MRIIPTLRLALVVGATVVALAGCGNKNTGQNLITAPNSPIADVPIPAGFDIDLGRSNSTVVPATQFRSVYHEYKGKDDLLPVVRFYRDQMPQKGWNAVDQQQVKDSVTLRFTKGKEDCSVTVWEGTLHTHIQVRIGPAGAVVGK